MCFVIMSYSQIVCNFKAVLSVFKNWLYVKWILQQIFAIVVQVCLITGSQPVCCRCWWCSTSYDTELRCSEVFQSSSGIWNASPRSSPWLLLPTNKLWQRHSREHFGAGRRWQQSRSVRVSRPQQSALLCMWCGMSWFTWAAQVCCLFFSLQIR